MAFFGQQLQIKRGSTVFGGRIHQRHDGGEVHHLGGLLAGAEAAVKVPVIHALGQSDTALPFDVFADVVLDRVEYPVAIFAFDVELKCFFHGCL